MYGCMDELRICPSYERREKGLNSGKLDFKFTKGNDLLPRFFLRLNIFFLACTVTSCGGLSCISCFHRRKG